MILYDLITVMYFILITLLKNRTLTKLTIKIDEFQRECKILFEIKKILIMY